MKARGPLSLLLIAGFAAGCGGAPTGLATIDVTEDGSVSAYLTDEQGALVYYEGVYLQVRGERTQLNYAGELGGISQLCQQLPTSGPLQFRMTAAFDACPEIHVAAYYYEPPTDTMRDGTKVPAPDVPVDQRCTTYQTLMHSTFWLPGGCEDVRSETN